MSEFPIKVLYKREKDNVVANFLIKNNEEEYYPTEERIMCFCAEALVNKSLVYILDEVKKAQEKKGVINYLKQKEYSFYDSLVYYHNLLYYLIVLRRKII